MPHPFRAFCGMGGIPQPSTEGLFSPRQAPILSPCFQRRRGRPRHSISPFIRSEAERSRKPTLSQEPGAPSIPRILRNGWDTTTLN